jgi:hypothetical protein
MSFPGSSVFTDMIAEVEAAILDADATSRECRERLVDPAVIDPDARGRAEDSESAAQRLRNAAFKLKELQMAAIAREEAAAWRADADKVQAVRDQLAAEFALRYPAIVSELVGLFTSITACDREIDRIHSSPPDTENRRLRKVEAEARCIYLAQGSILENCRLPNLLIGQHGASLAWPLSQPSVGLQLLSIFPKNGSPGSEEDEFYELVYDEVAGHYTMRRRPDAPPLALPSLRSRSDTAHP